MLRISIPENANNLGERFSLSNPNVFSQNVHQGTEYSRNENANEID
jgi:hypothetical protein